MSVEMSLINCEVNLILNWFAQYIITSNALSAYASIIAINNTKLYVVIVITSTEDNPRRSV